MKLSHITLGILLAGATTVSAQQVKNTVKTDSLKNKHKIKPLMKANIKQKDSARTSGENEKTKRRYCGPCGMG
jgi:hypothetical protein